MNPYARLSTALLFLFTIPAFASQPNALDVARVADASLHCPILLEFAEREEALSQLAVRLGLEVRLAQRSELRSIYRFVVLRRRERDYRLNSALRRRVDADLLRWEEQYEGSEGQFLALYDERGVLRATAALIRIAPGVAELKKTYIDPDPKFRNQGLGRALVERMIALARKWHMQRIELKTSSEMHEAIRLYEKLGFKSVPRLDPYGVSDLKYELDLAYSGSPRT